MIASTRGLLLAGLLFLVPAVALAGDEPDSGPLSGLAGRSAAPT